MQCVEPTTPPEFKTLSLAEHWTTPEPVIVAIMLALLAIFAAATLPTKTLAVIKLPPLCTSAREIFARRPYKDGSSKRSSTISRETSIACRFFGTAISLSAFIVVFLFWSLDVITDNGQWINAAKEERDQRFASENAAYQRCVADACGNAEFAVPLNNSNVLFSKGEFSANYTRFTSSVRGTRCEVSYSAGWRASAGHFLFVPDDLQPVSISQNGSGSSQVKTDGEEGGNKRIAQSIEVSGSAFKGHAPFRRRSCGIEINLNAVQLPDICRSRMPIEASTHGAE